MSFPQLPKGVQIVTDNFTDSLDWTEYLVFGAVLLASLGIGVFYGCFGNKNQTNEVGLWNGAQYKNGSSLVQNSSQLFYQEFLMAGRSMSILPVTLSLVCRWVLSHEFASYPYKIK